MRNWLSLFENSGDDYFSPEAHRQGAAEAGGNSRAIMIQMSPDDFLKVAKIGHDPDKERKVRGLVDSGTKLSEVPYLGFVHDGDGTAQVTSHEGRHRAMVLRSKGVKSMPVMFRHNYDGNGQSMRWSNMGRPGDKDFFRDDWPQRLYAEDRSGVYIPFPVPDMRPEEYHDLDHPLARPAPEPQPKVKPEPREPTYDQAEIDELRRQLGEGKEVFTNELDHEITVEVEPRDTDGVDGVWIDMIGPDSEAENHITRMEAETLYRLLGDALRDVENRVCKTPGADYQSKITDNEIGMTVKLPPEVEVPNMSDEQASEYEDAMHDAFEEIVAKMISDLDDDADVHWADAKDNDPIKENAEAASLPTAAQIESIDRRYTLGQMRGRLMKLKIDTRAAMENEAESLKKAWRKSFKNYRRVTSSPASRTGITSVMSLKQRLREIDDLIATIEGRMTTLRR